MTALGIAPESYTAVITSGETAWLGFSAKRASADPFFADFGRRCLFFSRDDDRSAIASLDLELVPTAESADFVWLSGLNPTPDTIARVEAELATARDRGLILLCTNPDLVSIEENNLGRGPGAFARDYESAGGEVRYVGKPWPAIYRTALARLDLPPARVLAVGDSLAHDIKGAAELGIDGALVTNGVHRETLAKQTSPAALLAALETLLAPDAPRPRWLLPSFRR